ncbi:MAG: SGNH/GDSL hydrolase family protein [Proteobacteria bacterium]|nr:SGNH/GDSL hydrolase family protein [Pseudomonadota bacterium]MBU1738380.1 SGNH/GDSL hydrolase family protein [Pseudomonadota bacterium]
MTRFKYIVFSVIPLLLLLVSLEVFFRLAGIGKPFLTTLPIWDGPLEILLPDPDIGFRLKPNSASGCITLNALGFRDHELNQKADIKILCLGDSVAFGWGVTDPSNTYSGVLEKILKEKAAAVGKTVEVFNGGIPSYQLYQGVGLYLHHLAKVTNWDYVICSFGWNESGEPGTVDQLGREDAVMLDYIRRNPSDENGLVKKLRNGAERLWLYNGMESLYVQIMLADEIRNANYPFLVYERQLTDFARAVKGNHARPVFLAIQVKEEDKGNNYQQVMLRFNSSAKKVAEKEQALFIETDLLFQKERPGWYDHVHFDEQGHRIIAESLGIILTRELNIPW